MDAKVADRMRVCPKNCLFGKQQMRRGLETTPTAIPLSSRTEERKSEIKLDMVRSH